MGAVERSHGRSTSSRTQGVVEKIPWNNGEDIMGASKRRHGVADMVQVGLERMHKYA